MSNPYVVGGYFVAGSKARTVGSCAYPPLYQQKFWHHGAGNGLPARVKCALQSGALGGCNCGCGCGGIMQPGCGYFNSQHNW